MYMPSLRNALKTINTALSVANVSKRAYRAGKRGYNYLFPRRKPRSHYTRIPKQLNPVPPITVMDLKYVVQLSLDPLVSTITEYQFQANGPFLPHVGGHQPLYWDQLAILYKDYFVESSNIKATLLPITQAATVVPTIFGITQDNANTFPYSNVSHIIEAKNKFTIGGPTWGTGMSKIVARASYNARKSTGMKDPGDDASNIGFVSSTNPGTGYVYHLWCASAGATDGVNTSFMVEINYKVRFSNPKVQTQS